MQSTLRRSISHNNLDETERAKKAVQLNYVRDGNPPYFKNACAWTSVVIPSIHDHTRGEKKFIFDELFDKYTLDELEKCGALNWCPGVSALMPLYASGDGNCLMHAASIFMWGYHDRRLELRMAVYDALIKGARGNIRERWRRFREHHNKNCSNSMQVSFDGATWETEWMQVVDVACPRSIDQRFESLEEVHIFVLSNVLRRPIIVLSQHTLYSVTGEAFQPVTMGGIYLPLLCDPLSCCKTPLVIGFANGHFAPLVFVSEVQDLQQAVPLVTPQFQPLAVHFTTQHENAESLMSEYLEVTELEVPSSSGHHKTINAAAFFPNPPPHQHIVNDHVTHLVEQYRQHQAQPFVPPPLDRQGHQQQVIPSALIQNEHQQPGGQPHSLIHDQFPEIHCYRCCTAGCPNFGNKEKDYLCSECSQQSQLFQKVQSNQRPQISPVPQHLAVAVEFQRSQGPERQHPPRSPVHGERQQLMNQPDSLVHDQFPDIHRYCCRTKGCPNYGNKEKNYLCSECSQQVQLQKKFQTPPIQGMPCSTPGCQRPTDPRLGFRRCVECHELAVIEESRREAMKSSSSGSRPQQHPIRVAYPSSGNATVQQLQAAQGRICNTPGCQYYADPRYGSYCTSCLEHTTFVNVGGRQQQGQTSQTAYWNTPAKLSTSQIGINDEFLFEVPPDPQGPERNQQSSVLTPFTKEVPEKLSKCRNSDCTNTGSSHDYGYCPGCFAKSIERYHQNKESDEQPNLPVRRNSSTHLSTLCQIEVSPRSKSGPVDMRHSDNTSVRAKGMCCTPDCAFFANPALGGYCSGCAKKKPFKAPEPRNMREVPPVAGKMEQPPPRPPKPAALNPQDIYNQIPCKRHGCPRLTPKDSPNGLCERCVLQSQSNHSTPTSPKPTMVPHTQQSASAPEIGVPKFRCRAQDCDFYADHAFSGYCSTHYRSHVLAAHDSSKQVLVNDPSNAK